MVKKISEKIENEIEKLSKTMTTGEVAKTLNVNIKAVYRVRDERGLVFKTPTNKKTDKKTEDIIISMFLNGHNTKYIADTTNMLQTTVSRIIRRHGYKVPYNMLNVTKEDENNICKLYKKGFSTVDISNIYKDKIKSDRTVANILRKHNIEVGSSGSRAIILNEDYFENINTESKAYFLGFIFADGNVHFSKQGKYIFQMMLKNEDAYILETLRNELGLKKKVKNFENNTVSVMDKQLSKDRKKQETSLSVCSKKIFNDLNSHGVVERKTFNMQFPNISQDLLRHFIRGYFDGDGCAYVSKSGNILLTFYGQHNFLQSIKDVLSKELGVKDNKIFDKKTLSQLSYGSKKDIKKIFDYFYLDSNYYLVRKRKKLSHVNTEVII